MLNTGLAYVSGVVFLVVRLRGVWTVFRGAESVEIPLPGSATLAEAVRATERELGR